MFKKKSGIILRINFLWIFETIDQIRVYSVFKFSAHNIPQSIATHEMTNGKSKTN